MELELKIEQHPSGLFNADITYQTSDGAKHSITALLRTNVFSAVIDALDSLVIMAPHLTQAEIDSHYSSSVVGT